MKKKILSLTLILCLVLTLFPLTTLESSATDVKNKRVYKITGYSSGSCVLSANVCMMRRAAIMSGSDQWKNITLSTARGKLCINGNTLKNDYIYKKDNITYKGTSGNLNGTVGTKKKKLIKLLKKHPEGIVVLGRYAWGPHGVLITGYKNGKFYCADSTLNIKSKNEGIVSWQNSTMLSLDTCTKYWYLEKVNPVEPAKLMLNTAKRTLKEGKSCKLTARISPVKAVNKDVTWTSKDPEIAKVNKNGKVTAVNAGTTTIIAKTHNGKTKKCTITVKEKTAYPSVTDAVEKAARKAVQ